MLKPERAVREAGVRELKIRTAQIVREVRERRARYIITYRGRPVAVIAPPGDRTGGAGGAVSRPVHRGVGGADAPGRGDRQAVAFPPDRHRAPVGVAPVMPVAGPCTVDASVFLSAFNPREPGHAESRRLLAGLQERMVPIVVPTLLLPEVAGAIGRGQRDSRLARQFASALAR